MPYRSPGIGDPRLDWILLEIQKAQATLDSRISEARSLSFAEPSKVSRITRLNQMKREVNTSFSFLGEQTQIWADRDIGNFYRRGHATAASQIYGSGFDFTLPHREALDLISFDAYDDVATRLLQVRSGFGANIELQKSFEGLDASQIATIQGRGRSAVAQALLTGEDPRKISRLFAQDLWSDGIPIIDSSGRQWKPETYTRMLVRTKSANAYNAGSLNKSAEEGVERVKVFDGVEDDPECAEAQGQTWALAYAMEHVIEHPNCRRAFAPEQGNGPVDKGKSSKKRSVFNNLQLGATGVAALRKFRNTGELNVSSTLARLVFEIAVEGTLGVQIPGLDLFVQRAVGAGFKNADAFVESFIDPVLYASGFIKEIPPRAALIKAARPEAFIDEILEAVTKTKTARFINTRGHEIDRVIEVLEETLKMAVAGLAEATEGKGGLKYAKWVADQVGFTGRLGHITGETVLQLREAGNFDDLRRLWLESTAYVDELSDIRKLHQRAMVGSYVEAQEVYQEISDLRHEINLLVRQADASALPTGQLMGEDLGTAYGLWAKLQDLGDPIPITLQRLAEIDRELQAAQITAFRRVSETKAFLLKRDARTLNFPKASGRNFVKHNSVMWDADQFVDDVAEFKRLTQKLGGGVAPDQDIAFVREFGKALQEASRDEKLTGSFIQGIESHFGDVDKVIEIWLKNDAESRAIMRAAGIIDEADHVISNSKFLKHMGDQLADFDFNGTEVTLRGVAKVTNEEQARAGFALIFSERVFLFADQIEDQAKALPSAFEGLLAFTKNGSFVELNVYVQQTTGFIDTLKITNVSDVTFASLGKMLDTIFPGKITTIQDGINGVKYVVELPSGGKIFLKSLEGQSGQLQKVTALQGEIKGNVAQYLHSWMGAQMGSESVASASWNIGDDIFGTAMPFIEDAKAITGLGPDAISTLSSRKLTLLDMLANEGDGHSGNFMTHRPSKSLVAIDRETGFFQNSDQFWLKNVVAGEYNERHATAWLAGDDLAGANLGKANMIPLSSDELDYIMQASGVKKHQRLGKVAPLKSGYDVGVQAGRKVPVPVFIDANGNGFLVGGRLGSVSVEFPTGLGGTDTAWVHRPNFHLTQEELDFVLQSAEDHAAGMRKVIEDNLLSLPDATQQKMVAKIGASSVEDMITELVEEAVTGLETRIDKYIKAGMININGGVEEVVTASGVRVAIGESINVLDEAGNPIQGMVFDIIEDRDGNTIARIVPGIGSNKSKTDLLTDFKPEIKLVDISEIRPSDIDIEITFQSQIREELSNVFPKFDHVRGDEAFVYETGSNGVLRQSTKKRIQIEMPNKLDAGFYVRGGDGPGALFQQALPDEIVTKLEKAVKNALLDLPPDERPLKVVIHAQALQGSDGRKVLGYFDADSREVHVAINSMFPDLRPDAKGRFIFDDVADLEKVFSTKGFEKVLDHELGHASAVAQEVKTRATVSKKVWEQMLTDSPDLKTENDFLAFAREELRKIGIPDDVDEPLRELLDFRIGIIEDVNNSRHASSAKSLVKSGKVDDLVAPEVLAAIKRGDPEAHQELVAELTEEIRRIQKTRVGAVSQESALKDIAFGRELTKSEAKSLRDLFIFDSSVPDSWDAGSLGFLGWFNKKLSGVGELIPVSKSKLRKFWKEAGLDSQYLARRGKAGGFTIDIVTGTEPPVGWAVAIKKNQHVIENFGDLSEDEFREVLELYAAEHRLVLDRDDWFLGGWHNKSKNQFVLDTTRVETDEITAAHFAFKEQQDAIFDLKTGVDKPIITKYADIDEYIDIEVPEAKRLKDELIDVLTPGKNVKTRKSLVDDLDRPVPISMKSFPEKTQDEIVTKLAKRKVIEADEIVYNKRGDTKLVPREGGKEIDASPKAIKERMVDVLEKAEKDLNIVDPRIEDDVLWASKHKMTVNTGSKVSPENADDLMSDLREAVNILQDNDVKIQGVYADINIEFLDGTSMRRFAEGGGPAPSTASVGQTIYINQKSSKNRVESIITEFARLTDPSGSKADLLQDRLKELHKIDIYDVIPSSRNLDLQEVYADVFQLVMNGNAPPAVAVEMREVVDQTLRGKHRFYRTWRTRILATAVEEEVEFKRVAGLAAVISPGMDADINLEMALYITRSITRDKGLSVQQVQLAKDALRKSAKAYIEVFDSPEVAARLLAYADELSSGMKLSNMNSEMATRVMGALAQKEGVTWAVPKQWAFIEKGTDLLRGNRGLLDTVVETKTRSFYNNIVDPMDVFGVTDVTVDFHMLDLSFRANTKGGAQGFGTKPSVDGLVIGRRAIIADIVRDLYNEGWGFRVGAGSPAELQEVLWGVWRDGKKVNRWGDLQTILDVLPS